MREFELDNPKKEFVFKASKKVEDNVDHDDEFDNVEENIVRILKKGIEKYKGKLCFKCFNCGRIA